MTVVVYLGFKVSGLKVLKYKTLKVLTITPLPLPGSCKHDPVLYIKFHSPQSLDSEKDTFTRLCMHEYLNTISFPYPLKFDFNWGKRL